MASAFFFASKSKLMFLTSMLLLSLIIARFFYYFYSEQGLIKTQYNAWIPIAKASIKEPRKKKNKN